MPELDLENSLTVTHYKEPLLAVPKGKGFGYLGALSISLDRDKMQCHICGKLFRDVGFHTTQKHNISRDEYKEKYQIARSTSLISETLREEKKNRTLLYRASLSKNDAQDLVRKMKEGSDLWHKNNPSQPFEIRLETKNKRGTCPDQLIAKIQEVANELKKTPSKREFITACGTQRFVHLIYSTFGSYNAAIERAGLVANQKWTTPVGFSKPRYSDDELLDYLSLVYREEGRIPTETDARRGLIPNTDIYRRRFGSMAKARELAGIQEDIPSRKGTSYIK